MDQQLAERARGYAAIYTYQGSVRVALYSCFRCQCYISKCRAESFPVDELPVCKTCRDTYGYGNRAVLRSEYTEQGATTMDRTCKGCGVTFTATDDAIVAQWLGVDAVDYCNEACWADHTMPTECQTCHGIVGSDVPNDRCTCKEGSKMVTKQDALDNRLFHYGTCSETIGPRGGRTVKVTVVRASGQVQTWKRDPQRFRLPIMHGLYGHGEITNDNCSQFHVAATCPVSRW